MEIKTTIVPLNSQTFEYQNYDTSDKNLIAQSNLDTAFTASTDYIEYYIYDQNQTLIYPPVTVPLVDYNIREGDVLLDPSLNLESRGYDLGTYNILYNFYRKHLASNTAEKYYISEISSDRTEIRLDSNIIANELIISSSNSFIQYRENSTYFIDFYLNFGENQTVIANNLKLETEEGVEPTILVKLYEPLPSNFNVKNELWVVEELSDPQAYEVKFPFIPIIEDDFTFIAGPNYSLNITQQTGTPSEGFSYSTLINSDITSSINQIQSLLNEKQIDINIDYENYGNFVNFSSATTRLENFYYKVGLIESSSNELEDFYGLVTSNTINQTYFSASTANLKSQINDIIKNFDGYEYFLYFNSGSLHSYPKSNTEPPFQLYPTGSNEVLTWIGNSNINDPYYGGQALSASNYNENNRDWLYWSIPEYLRDDSDNVKYELFVDMVGQYYDNVWVYTKDVTNKFDADNRLDYGISKDLVADAIKDFAIKLYSNNFNTDDLFTAFLGLTPSGDLFPVPNITGSIDGIVNTPTGYEYVDTKISASNDIVPLNDVQKRLYKRIYHNIPYLLKTKGTVAGIRALITSYGIPDTILRISEFGGKDRNEKQDYDLKQDVFNYAFDTGVNATNYVESSLQANSKFPVQSGDNKARTIQLRFKSPTLPLPVNNVASSNIRPSQSLWSTNEPSGNLVLEYNGAGLVTGSYSGSIPDPYDTYGTLKWIPAEDDNPAISASVYLPFFNGDWWSVQMNVNGSRASLYAANVIDGKIGFNESSSTVGFDDSFYYESTIGYLNKNTNVVFNDGTTYTPFSGSFQELRYYVNEISQSHFYDYAVNPYSNEGNGINSTPNQQFFRAALGTQLDTGSRTSIHPRVTGSAVQITQSFNNDTSTFSINNTKWVTNVEDIFQDQAVAGMKNRITEKVILKDNKLAEAPYGYNMNNPDRDGDFLPTQGIITASALSSMRSLQVNSFTSQSYTPTVNYLEVAFSPSNQINDDINAQLGYFNIGDYIGDPRFISSSDYSYPNLDRLRDQYFEKYISSYNVVDFIRLIKFFDNSLFKMIKDFTPARTSLASGVVIKQHLLERNRQRPAQVTSSNATLEGLVVNLPKNYSSGSSDYPQYSTSGSSIYKFTGGSGGSVNKWNGMQTYPSVLGRYGSLLGGVNLLPVIISDTVDYITNGTYDDVIVDVPNKGNGEFPLNTDILLNIEVYNFNNGIGDIEVALSELSQQWSEGNIITIPGNDFGQGDEGEITIQLTRAQIDYAGPVTDPKNRFNVTQSYEVMGTARDPYNYSIINGTYFNYSSSQFLSASYQGSGSTMVSTQHEFYDGEFSGSNVIVTTQSLNPGCGPYLNVVDRGVLYNPIFFNNQIQTDTQGTVTLETFGDTANQPYEGDAWIFSQRITNPQILRTTGASPNFNYVTFIKLSRIDTEGNDVTDYLIPGTNIQISLPDAIVFGNGLPTYVIEGIIPDSNSVRIRIAIEKGSNRFWNPIISTNYSSIVSAVNPPTILGGIYPDTSTAADITTFKINPIDAKGVDYSSFLTSMQDGTSQGTIKMFNDTYEYIYTINRVRRENVQIEYALSVVPKTIPTTEFFPVGTSFTSTIFYEDITYFPITSSANGGSENWSFAISSSWVSSEDLKNSTDLWQQGNFINNLTTSQTQFTTVYAPSDATYTYEPYTTASINPILPNSWTYGKPLAIGYPSGVGTVSVQGQYLAAGMLSPINQANSTWTDIWSTGAYTLNRTPNVPLNFIMELHYSASDRGTGPGVPVTSTQTGNYHSGQGYDPNVAGNFNQTTLFTNSSELGGSVVAKISSTSYDTLTEALAATGYETNFAYALNSFSINQTLWGNSALNQFYDGALQFPKYYPLTNLAGELISVGVIGIDFNPSSPKFAAFYSTTGLFKKGTPGEAVGEVKSGLFIPPTANEGLSSPFFMDNINPLIPGNSGSMPYNATPTTINSPGGHPKVMTNGTASMDYDFGTIQTTGDGASSATIEATFLPISGSSLSIVNGDWDYTSIVNTQYRYYTTASLADEQDGRIGIDYMTDVPGTQLTNLEYWKRLTNKSVNGTFSDMVFTPTYNASIIAYNTPGEPLNATASIQVRNGSANAWSDVYFTNSSVGRAYQTVTSTINIENPKNGVEETVSIWVMAIDNQQDGSSYDVPDNQDIGDKLEFRVVIKTAKPTLFLIVNNFAISQMRFQYAYTPVNTNIPSLYSITRTSGNGTTIDQYGNGIKLVNNNTAYGSLNQSIAGAPVFSSFGTIDVEAFLKYTGSINNGTDLPLSVDTILLSSGQFQQEIYPGVLMNFTASNNKSGTFTNPVTYDVNNDATTSSTLNISGGMYYIEYSMSNFVQSIGNDMLIDFNRPANPSFDNSSIVITQTIATGESNVDNPTATIYPNIYYGQLDNQTTFGEPMQWLDGEVASVDVTGVGDTGFYQFSGQFVPTSNASRGWDVGDTFRMGTTVEKTGGNIGVTIISSSMRISPGQSPYAEITASIFEPNVYRVPTLSEFGIPTFYQDGVLPFSFALDCQPLLNNYNDARPSRYLMDIDYSNESGPVIPVNQAQILEGIATRATIPDSNYSTAGWVLPRYLGSNSTCDQINIFTYGDTGCYGQLPNIEVRLAYFAYFESIVNPYPLYNNVTQLNVAYLVDEQENALPPSLGGQSFEIMNTLYPPKGLVSIQINSGSDALQEINGFNTIKGVGQRWEPIAFSQNSSANYATVIPLSGSGTISIYDDPGNVNAKTTYGISAYGSGVTGIDNQANMNQTKKFSQVLAPTGSIIRNTNNNAAAGYPYNYLSEGIFEFTSGVDNDPAVDLKNPQTIFMETSYATSYIYESGQAEVEMRLRCVLERGGVERNIPFLLEDITLDVYWLGKEVNLGSVIGQFEGVPNIMIRFIGPNGGGSTPIVYNANNEVQFLIENNPYHDFIYNKGINWKNKGGQENGGPVEWNNWNISANTNGFIFKSGDKVRFELDGDMPRGSKSRGALNSFYPVGFSGDTYLPTNFTVIGANDSAAGDNEATAPFWEFPSSGEQNVIEMTSPNFNEAYGSAWKQGYVPYTPGASEFFEGGFEPSDTKFPSIKQPIQFKINDEIRFVNNENYTYTIIGVTPPQQNVDLNDNIGKVKLKLNKEVPSSINKDFFLIRRPSNDASIAYLAKDFPYVLPITDADSPAPQYSSPGLILPEFPSEYINLSASQIINNLISKGVIQS